MCQVFPHHGHPMEGLLVPLGLENGKTWYQERTSLILCGSPSGYDLTRLTRTLEPSRVPSRTRLEVEGRLMSRRGHESIQDFGSNSLIAHIFPSSCKDSWNTGLAGSEIPTRTCTCSERRVEKDGSVTHTIQVLDEPRRIFALQVRKTVSILVPTKEAAELVVKLWRSSVEIVELL